MVRPFKVVFSLALLCLAAALCPAPARGEAAAPYDLRGVWTGLLQGGSYETTGYARVVLNRNGRGSASVKIGDEPNCVVGMWWQPDGSFIRTGGDPDMGINLRVIALPGNLLVIKGTVTDDGHTMDVELVKAAPTPPEEIHDRYTVAIANTTGGTSLPTGVAAAGALHVLRNGYAIFIARLSNGSIAAHGAVLDGSGRFPLLARTTGGGILSGLVEFANDTTSDCTAALTLNLPSLSNRAGAVTREEESIPLSLVGSRHDPAQGFDAAPGWSLTYTPAPGVAAPILPPFTTWTDLVFPAGFGRLVGNGGSPQVRLVRASGVIRGIFPMNDGVVRNFGGVYLQKTKSAAAIVRLGEAFVGTVTLAPNYTVTNAGVIKTGAGNLVLTPVYTGGTITTGGTTQIHGGTLTLNGNNMSSGATQILGSTSISHAASTQLIRNDTFTGAGVYSGAIAINAKPSLNSNVSLGSLSELLIQGAAVASLTTVPTELTNLPLFSAGTHISGTVNVISASTTLTLSSLVNLVKTGGLTLSGATGTTAQGATLTILGDPLETSDGSERYTLSLEITSPSPEIPISNL